MMMISSEKMMILLKSSLVFAISTMEIKVFWDDYINYLDDAKDSDSRNNDDKGNA